MPNGEQHLECKIGEYAIIENSDRKVLIMQLTKTVRHIGGKWTLPGGRINHGESAENGLQREVLEETGIMVEPEEIVYTFANYEGRTPTYRVFYMCHLDDGLSVRLSDEHQKYQWVSIEEAKQFDFAGKEFLTAIQHIKPL